MTAGLMVGLVALPLALGFGVSSGMGATAGLVTAIVAGAVAAIFGGSRVQVLADTCSPRHPRPSDTPAYTPHA